MKTHIYLLVSVILFSCSTTKKTMTVSDNNTNYLIKKIDKNNSWYIIYAERKDTLFKIVSYAESKVDENCKKIVVGGKYDFELKSKKENVPVINGIRLKPMNHLDVESKVFEKDGVECYVFDKKTTICLDPKRGIYDLFYTNDLKGICYLK